MTLSLTHRGRSSQWAQDWNPARLESLTTFSFMLLRVKTYRQTFREASRALGKVLEERLNIDQSSFSLEWGLLDSNSGSARANLTPQLNFLICEMGIILIRTSHGCCKNWRHMECTFNLVSIYQQSFPSSSISFSHETGNFSHHSRFASGHSRHAEGTWKYCSRGTDWTLMISGVWGQRRA